MLNQLAMVSTLSGVDATDVAREAVAAAVDAGSPVTESHARNTLGVCLVIGGREDDGLAELVRAGELGRGSRGTMLRFYINYSDALCLAGRYAEAVEQALAGVEVAAGLGLERSTGAMLAGNAAEPLLALGEWDRASQLSSGRWSSIRRPTTSPICGCSSAGCGCRRVGWTRPRPSSPSSAG